LPSRWFGALLKARKVRPEPGNSGVIGYPSRDTVEEGKKVFNRLGQAAQSLTPLLISEST
jgi:hypothetical protein